MRNLAVTVVWIAGVVLFASGLSGAQDGGCQLSGSLRQFKGQVERVGANVLAIDSGNGDEVEFARDANVKVMGEKTDWNHLGKTDWVLIGWSMADEPRRAREVCVIPTAAPQP